MARRIKWSQTAAADLEEIVDYIALDSPVAARRVARRLRKAALSLSDLPDRGRRVPELPSSPVRELIVGSYRLIYHVEPEAVHVIAIVHSARDLAALWEKR